MSHNHDTNHQTTTVHGDTVVPFEKTAKKSLRRDVSVAPSQHTSLKFRKPNKNDYFRVSDRPEHAPFPASIWEHNDGDISRRR